MEDTSEEGHYESIQQHRHERITANPVALRQPVKQGKCGEFYNGVLHFLIFEV
jgi:hypothetical protein